MAFAANTDSLAMIATGRAADPFEADVRLHSETLKAAIGGRRILMVGGAGSIGSATASALAHFQPASLHVIDHNENGLTELVRDFRSDAALCTVPDLRALPLDYGAPVMRRFLESAGRYDLVLNFAALKHVRSEKDIYSLTQLIDTNLVKHARFLGWLRAAGSAARYFCVSTDKAANPVSLMGASKRLMEHLIFSQGLGPGCVVTSARFANVAFSAGSLLAGFMHRLEKNQPLAVPAHVGRFFVSLPESGRLCLLAATAGPDRHIIVPAPASGIQLRELQQVAVEFLAYQGLEAHVCESEASARACLQDDVALGRYPLLVTSPDTSGEKPYEEFVGEGERLAKIGFRSLCGIRYEAVDADIRTCMEALTAVAEGTASVDKRAIIDILTRVVPTLRHRETQRHLDQRM